MEILPQGKTKCNFFCFEAKKCVATSSSKGRGATGTPPAWSVKQFHVANCVNAEDLPVLMSELLQDGCGVRCDGGVPETGEDVGALARIADLPGKGRKVAR